MMYFVYISSKNWVTFNPKEYSKIGFLLGTYAILFSIYVDLARLEPATCGL